MTMNSPFGALKQVDAVGEPQYDDLDRRAGWRLRRPQRARGLAGLAHGGDQWNTSVFTGATKRPRS
jgi:hypothetical protein